MARPKSTGRASSRRADPAQDERRGGHRGRSAQALGDTETATSAAEREMLRQAECAAMLIAVTRMLLNLRGRDFAVWLRSIADDFEATDPEPEDVEDLSDELIRMGTAGLAPDEADADPDKAPAATPPAGRRPH
jgi:hypothetical protein